MNIKPDKYFQLKELTETYFKEYGFILYLFDTPFYGEGTNRLEALFYVNDRLHELVIQYDYLIRHNALNEPIKLLEIIEGKIKERKIKYGG